MPRISNFVCSTCPARLYTKNPNCEGCSKKAANDRPSTKDPNYMDHYHCTTIYGLLKKRKET